MVGFLRRVLDVTEAHRLRRRALRDSSPQSTIELCRLLQRQGRVKASRETARAGLMRFPHSAELKEILHATWKRTEGRKLKELEERLRREPTVDSHIALVEYYQGFNELDKALDAASRLIQSHPQDPRGFIVHGRVLIARFHRDHVAQDGGQALASFQRAAELDPKSFEANFALAETYYYIGAVSRALFHLYRALDISPEHTEANRLYRILIRLPLEKEDEGELLREVEENDEAHFRYVPDETEVREAKDGALPAFMLARLEQLSLMAGVRRLAFCHRGEEIVAQAGARRANHPGARDSFIELAVGFRRTASLSAKRMGIGAFEEAELSWEGGRILAAAAGPTIMLIETEPSPRLSAIAAEARNFIAGCIIAAKGNAA